MKRTQSILTFFLASMLLFSCAQEFGDVQGIEKEELYRMLISDPMYGQLKDVDDQQAYNLATHKYDLMGIINFSRERGVSVCDIDKADISHIKGALVYQEIECRGQKTRMEYFTKYKAEFSNLTVEDHAMMTKMYRASKAPKQQLTADQIIQERAKNEIQK